MIIGGSVVIVVSLRGFASCSSRKSRGRWEMMNSGGGNRDEGVRETVKERICVWKERGRQSSG